MSGFDTTWLDHREPADDQARDTALLDAAAETIRASKRTTCIDLGCGTGSTLRTFARRQVPVSWRLVDNDAGLLEEARRRAPDSFAIETVETDISDLAGLEVSDAALVTASALFDLCSQDFIERLAEKLIETRVGLYAALNYDGSVEWDDTHPLDVSVVTAFNAHQHGDKGFGPALGPDAGFELAAAFDRNGFRVRTAQSPWQLGPASASLQDLFLTGMARAVAETGEVDRAALDDWLAMRRSSAQTTTCRVGHIDVLAVPG